MAFGYSVTIGCDGDWPRPDDIGAVLAGVRRCGEYVGSDTHPTQEGAVNDAYARACKFGWRIDSRGTFCAAHKAIKAAPTQDALEGARR